MRNTLRYMVALTIPMTGFSADVQTTLPPGSITMGGQASLRMDLCMKNLITSRELDTLIKPFREKTDSHPTGFGQPDNWRCDYWGKWFTALSIRKNIFCNAPDSRCFNFGPKPPTGMHLIKVDQNCYFQVNPKDALVQLGTKRFTATEFDAYRKTTGWDTRSVVGDPQFVAPALGDFRLKPDSPAQGLGSQMSLQPE